MCENGNQNGNVSGGETPEFDTEAFKKRFNEITERTGEAVKEEPSAPQEEKGMKRMKKRTKNKKRTAITILCIVLALVLLLTGSAVGSVLYVTKDYKAIEMAPNAYVDDKDLMHKAGVTNILLMGIDTKHMEDHTRSDSMILLTIDTIRHKLKLTSFMRDMYVAVPGHGNTKLTHACAYAGPQLTVDTIELNFGVRIDGYVKISYALFVELVNGIGGITVPEIDETESKALAREGVNIEPGTNIHLNGHQTLNYCRIRKGQSDFQRTERQREALSLIIKQAMKTSPFKLLKVGRSIASKAECSLEKGRLLKIAMQALPCALGEVVQQRIPLDGTWDNATRDGLSVLLVDFDKNKEFLKESLF